MKRFLCVTLAILLTLALLACGKEETVKEEAPAWAGQFAAGYGKVNVTPKYPVVMRGYNAAGEPTRKSQGVLNDLYITCVALTDETGNTVLLYTYDNVYIDNAVAPKLLGNIAEGTGIPQEKIFICVTHTHSSPVHDPVYLAEVSEAAVKAAQDAMADRAVATVEYTATQLENMSFVRHYNTDTGIVVGSNFYPEGAGNRISHTTEADKELRLIRLNREGKQPILMANWLGHNSIASTGTTEYGLANRYLISSDFVGFCREYVEYNSDYLFAMYMGASGNIAVHSDLVGEPGRTTAVAYGTQLGQMVLDAAETMTAGQTGTIGMADTEFDGVDQDFSIHAIGTGSLGFITGPIEMFDTTAMSIREQSPYDVTFVLTLTNGAYWYVPTEVCYDYVDCYEVRAGTNFQRGDAERMAQMYVDLLKQTKN